MIINYSIKYINAIGNKLLNKIHKYKNTIWEKLHLKQFFVTSKLLILSRSYILKLSTVCQLLYLVTYRKAWYMVTKWWLNIRVSPSVIHTCSYIGVPPVREVAKWTNRINRLSYHTNTDITMVTLYTCMLSNTYITIYL